MESCFLPSAHFCSIANFQSFKHTKQVLVSHRVSCNARVSKPLPCKASIQTDDSVVIRRSANFHPAFWNHDYLMSLTSNYTGEIYTKRAKKLEEDVRMMMNSVDEALEQLEFIDVLQRLGLAYHFEDEIKRILQKIHSSSNEYSEIEDLYATSLKFRLLRQHGYHVSHDVFDKFKDEKGNFKTSVSNDLKGMLSLYEASFYSIEGEEILESAWEFATKNLEIQLDRNIFDDPNLAIQIKHSLEMPLHWRIAKLESRKFIDIYAKKSDMIPTLLEFAKLDFNMVQGLYKEELREISIWWDKTKLAEKMSFVRDRLVASYLWAVGICCEPQFSYARKIITKSILLITVIDDIYDVYGTLDEVTLFTDVVVRWDMNAINELPDFMKLPFLALYNYIHDTAYEILKEQDYDIIPHLKTAWAGIFKAYFQEAKWFHSGYTPTLDEYMKNAWISITGPLIITQTFMCTKNPITLKEIEFLETEPDILRWPNIIFRYQDDLGTSTEEIQRGDNAKAIQCYMKEAGVSEEVAREHIRDLTRKAWKKVNKYRVADSPVSRTCIEFMLNIARTSQCVYQYGDGYGGAAEEEVNKDNRVASLLFDHIPF